MRRLTTLALMSQHLISALIMNLADWDLSRTLSRDWLIKVKKHPTFPSPHPLKSEHLFLLLSHLKIVIYTGFHTPTPVQKAVIPRLLNGENLVMAASTGSGKTLAFTLPVIQTLISQEQQVSNELKFVKD